MSSTASILSNVTWSKEPAIKQNFSIPSSIIYYISKNPLSPTAYLKLAKSCKYFFERLPLLVANDMSNGSILCSSETNEECENSGGRCCVEMDFVKMKSKIWLNSKIAVNENETNRNLVSMLCSKIYQCDAQFLEIHNQKIYLSEFEIIASSAIHIFMVKTQILNDRGSNVKFDQILKTIPEVEIFKCDCCYLTFDIKTLKKVATILHESCIEQLDLYDIHMVQDVRYFYNVVEAKYSYHVQIRLSFTDNFAEEFQHQLNELVNKLVEKETFFNCLVNYKNQNEELFQLMENELGQDPFF